MYVHVIDQAYLLFVVHGGLSMGMSDTGNWRGSALHWGPI